MTNQIDYVNEDGKTLGVTDLNIVHKNLLLHKSAHIFIVDSNGRVFCRKIASGNPIYPGYWSTSVGAHVLSGMDYDATAKESLKSSLGVNCKLEMIGKVRIKDDRENEVSATYVGYSNKVKINEKEAEDGRFFTLEELKDLMQKEQCTPHLLQSLELYLQKKH